MVRVGHDVRINLVSHFPKLALTAQAVPFSTDFLAFFTIEFDASPRAADHKIVGPCIHSAWVSAHHACA
jgi:hypothetical protein